MIQEVRLCIILLKNLEAGIEDMLTKCNEVKRQHIDDKVLIDKLLKELEELKANVSEKNNSGEQNVPCSESI